MGHKLTGVADSRIVLGFITTLALACLISCGGGSTSSDPGTTITASFAGATMPSSVAYQVGTTGTFKTIALAEGSVSFTLPLGTEAYGIAYICPTFLDGYSFSNTSTVQATTAEATDLSFTCPSLAGSISATFDASAIPEATTVLLYVGDQALDVSGTSGSAEMSNIPTGTFDVGLVAVGASGPLALQILRGVTISGSSSNSVTFPPMMAADELGTSGPVTITGVPSDANDSGFGATYHTSGGLSIDLNWAQNSPSTHPTAPSSQSQSGDYYLIEGLALMPNQEMTATLSSSTANALTVTLPAPLGSVPNPTPAAYPTFQANTGGFTVAGTVVNSASIQYQTTPGSSNTYYNIYTYVTQSWLGTSTTFTVPNLSVLVGFGSPPPSGGKEPWNLYSCAGTPLQISTSQQSAPEIISPTMSVQSTWYSGGFITP
jgi:hypothetical protein